MPILKAPDIILATTTAVRTVLPDRRTWYTIYNNCRGSLYYIADPELASVDFTGTSAALRALGGSELKSEREVSFFADAG